MRHAGDAFESYTFVRKWGELYEQIMKWTARNVPKKLVKMPKKLSKILREKKISKIPKKINKIQKKLWKYRETNLQDTENSTKYRKKLTKKLYKIQKNSWDEKKLYLQNDWWKHAACVEGQSRTQKTTWKFRFVGPIYLRPLGGGQGREAGGQGREQGGQQAQV